MFPPNKVHQLAKKIESSKVTAKHMKQVASDLQATQIHLIWHQHTELLPTKFQRKQKKHFKPGRIQTSNIPMRKIMSNITKKINKEEIIVIKHMQAKNYVRSVVIQGKLRDLDVQWPDINIRVAINLVISVACGTRRLDMKTKGPWSWDHQTTSIEDWLSLCTRFYMWSIRRFNFNWWIILLANKNQV